MNRFLVFCCFTCFVLLFGNLSINASNEVHSLSGMVIRKDNQKPIEGADVYIESINYVTKTDAHGHYHINGIAPGKYLVQYFQVDFNRVLKEIEIGQNNVEISVELEFLDVDLDEVVIEAERTDFLSSGRLRSVENHAIYAAKKNEVIDLDRIDANLATNNSRQIFAKVAGLNIWESDGAGLQLGIGARGLSPNRTSNFNTRQNGYDISADALGYPESYYTPPTEAVERIEVVRGAASLQYGTQFGGMVNFQMKQGTTKKIAEVNLRQTVGSFGLFNSFNSIGGSKGKWRYYSFYQYKRGDGWRPNSDFQLHTGFASVSYQANKKLRISADYTHENYLAHQPGGLTDLEFEQNPRQSNRERNWFKVNWNLASLSLDYQFSTQTSLNIRNFGLLASRQALGFLGLISRVDPVNSVNAADYHKERDLLYGQFRNWGNESRLTHQYMAFSQPATLLVGTRYYQGYTTNRQGNANSGYDADFAFLNPDLLEKSDYDFPSKNVAFFAENLFNLSEKWSVTPGFRLEYIQTGAEGYHRQMVRDLADNIILDSTYYDQKNRSRYLGLLGLGIGFRPQEQMEIYANISQNYRAINFNDFKVDNPSYRIDEDLRDERGFNIDLGIRGRSKDWLTYDASIFYLYYANRIGFLQMTDPTLFSVYRYKTNIADSRTFGLESVVEADILRLLDAENTKQGLTIFGNIALIDAKYINTDEPAILDKKVELAPTLTTKTGISYRRNNLSSSLQYAYTSEQFTDATNARKASSSAVTGLIPAYYTLDFSMSYTFDRWKFDAGINNLTNNMYFTRRASGYPGPGIIPSDGRSFYITFGLTL